MNPSDNRPVGIFDSGLGGLTSLKAIRELLPHEDLIFFGDTARVPYGNRTREELIRFSEQNIRFLQSKNVKAVVVACNTSDAMARAEVSKEFDLPIVGVIDPSAREAADATLTGSVGVIGTHVTVTSGLFNLLIPLYNPLAQVSAVETPKLVPLVEGGKTHPTDTETVETLREYLAPFRDGMIDTLVLGCTHYPLLAGIIGGLCRASRWSTPARRRRGSCKRRWPHRAFWPTGRSPARRNTTSAATPSPSPATAANSSARISPVRSAARKDERDFC